MAIELQLFKAKTQLGDFPNKVAISKSGALRIPILAQEKIGVDENSYLNCFFDKNDKNYVYLVFSKFDEKKSNDGYVASKGGKQTESSIMFNVGGFLKRLEYNHDETRVFDYEIIDISGKDYIRINITVSEVEPE